MNLAIRDALVKTSAGQAVIAEATQAATAIRGRVESLTALAREVFIAYPQRTRAFWNVRPEMLNQLRIRQVAMDEAETRQVSELLKYAYTDRSVYQEAVLALTPDSELHDDASYESSDCLSRYAA